MSFLKIENISKTFNKKLLLKNIDLSLNKSEILCILGPSGCGKTTLLKIIAGLDAPDTGRIIFDKKDITSYPAYIRRFGMMFQDFALFPHKNVFENIAFGLEMQKKEKTYIKNHVEKMLDIVGLKDFSVRMTHDLSGGERQRVALARSLACQPKLLLLDEPMGFLDKILRERLILDIKRIIRELELTAIFVTHDQTEAFSISDTTALIYDGKIEQIDSPDNIYKKPATVFIAKFLGFDNLFEADITEKGVIKSGIGEFKTSFSDKYKEKSVTFLIKEEALSITDKKDKTDSLSLNCKVSEKIFKGFFYQIIVEACDKRKLSFFMPSNIKTPDINDNITLKIDTEKIIFLKVR